MSNRPIDIPDFKLAITDPLYFIGRNDLIKNTQNKPLDVKIILGGRRIGKTSTLKAIEWNLLNPNQEKVNRAFPVFIDLALEQPKGLDNLRYILIARLRESIYRWKKVPGASIREMYGSYLRQIAGASVTVNFLEQMKIKLDITNPDRERQLIHDDFKSALLKTIDELQKHDFQGICFLLDRADFIAHQNDWANDAWCYFRGLKDTETALKPFLGILLSGYRQLKEYQQEVGSPLLNIAKIEWLSLLTKSEALELINYRRKNEKIPLTDQGVETVIEWTGCHPYLTQQMLCTASKIIQDREPFSTNKLIENLLSQHDNDFSAWWNENEKSGGFGDRERLLYRSFITHRQETARKFAQHTSLSRGDVKKSLNILLGHGVLYKLDNGQYKIGARLFEEWVKQQS